MQEGDFVDSLIEIFSVPLLDGLDKELIEKGEVAAKIDECAD